MKGTFLLLMLAGSFHLSIASGSWPQFRGPNSSGVAGNGRPPVEFSSETNRLWKVEVPPGLSSPCVWNDRVFLTAFAEGKLVALCFDGLTGRELWRQEAPPGEIPGVHKISSPAVATPATDGSRVYVYFVSFGLVAYDFTGREQWRKAVPSGFVMNGSGTSPIDAADTVILNCDQEGDESFLLAVDARTGKTRWQIARQDFISSYTTPITWRRGTQEDVVVAGSLRVVGYDLRNGQERWSARVLTSVSVAATPAVGSGQLYVMSRGVPPTSMGTFADFAAKNDKDGDGRIAHSEVPRGFDGGLFRVMDRDKDGAITAQDWTAMTNLFAKGDSGLFALRAPGEGDITATHVAWKQTRGVAGISSPLYYDGRIYVVQDGGRLSCSDAKTGEALYSQERIGAAGEYYASPIAANGHVYLSSSRGTISVVPAGNTLEVKARNELGESVMATPAIVGDKLYVRSANHLWAFGKN